MGMEHKIYLEQIPKNHTIQTYIRENTDWLAKREEVNKRFSYDPTKIYKISGFDFDLENLKKSAYESFDKHGSGNDECGGSEYGESEWEYCIYGDVNEGWLRV